MAAKPLPSPEVLRQLLRYEPETGKLFWLPRPREFFPSDWAWKVWNKRYANNEALTATSRGYKVGNVLGRLLFAHNVIRAIHYGEWPEDETDHFNLDKSDNRISNLRPSSRSQNLYNKRAYANSKTGIKGVSFHEASGKYRASINCDGEYHYLGLFESAEEAAQTRREAAKRLHGAFARSD